MVVRIHRYIIQFLILVGFGVIVAVTQAPDGNMHIIACDVGQGDAVLVTYKDVQILTDGGPDSSVLDCLGRHVPFWDRDIELVISSHPDADHSTGLIDVIKRYNVGKIVVNPIDPGTDIYRLLENAVGGRGVEVINPVRGMGLRVGMIYLDIVAPDASKYSKLDLEKTGDKLAEYKIGRETNLYSIVYNLSFKKFTGLFPGDIPKEVSDELSFYPDLERVNYIKTPHHGSANGLTDNLLKAVEPKVAVISVGKKNIWGFPSPEILKILGNHNAVVLRTDQMGDVEVITDGDKFWWKK